MMQHGAATLGYSEYFIIDICPMLVEKISDTASEGLSILLRNVRFSEEFDHQQFLALS